SPIHHSCPSVHAVLILPHRPLIAGGNHTFPAWRLGEPELLREDELHKPPPMESVLPSTYSDVAISSYSRC
ncbi:unnamed protein product, partial [Urochloa humidicola]